MSQTWNMVERDMKTDEYFSLKMKLLPTKIIPKDENLELSYDHEFNVRSVCVCVIHVPTSLWVTNDEILNEAELLL